MHDLGLFRGLIDPSLRAQAVMNIAATRTGMKLQERIAIITGTARGSIWAFPVILRTGRISHHCGQG